MIPNAIIKDFEALPVDAQQQIIDFIAFIKTRYQTRKNIQPTALEHSFGSIEVKKRVSLAQMDAVDYLVDDLADKLKHVL